MVTIMAAKIALNGTQHLLIIVYGEKYTVLPSFETTPILGRIDVMLDRLKRFQSCILLMEKGERGSRWKPENGSHRLLEG